MTTGAMSVADHVRAAREFLDHSHREFSDGQILQGSDKLWGAASHAVMALDMQRGWRFSKYNARVHAINRLVEEYDEPLLAADFGIAEKFHANFYHDFMEDDEIDRGRPMVGRLVNRVLEIVAEAATE